MRQTEEADPGLAACGDGLPLEQYGRATHGSSEHPCFSVFIGLGVTVRRFERRQGRANVAASPSERPRDHQREFFPPERVTRRCDSLAHDDVCSGVAQRVRPLLPTHDSSSTTDDTAMASAAKPLHRGRPWSGRSNESSDRTGWCLFA